jgi:hypothetical protein
MSVRTIIEIRVGLPTVVMLVVVVGAASFAAGRGIPASSEPTRVEEPPRAAAPVTVAEDDDLPLGHPTTGQGPMDLPAGHPPIGSATEVGETADPDPDDSTSLEWTAPPRWHVAPNTNRMRLATYRVPRATGDAADAELSIAMAGGSVDANADRWIGQFDPEGRSSAKRSVRKVGSLDVLVVEVQGSYSGGMAAEAPVQPGWALLGAIVPMPGMPYFFKLTGPAKSVAAARGEFDAMIASLRLRGT